MKAFFSRLHLGTRDKEKDLPIIQKEKFPPLRQWPPAPEPPQRSASTTSSSYAVFKPLPVPEPALDEDDAVSADSIATPTPTSTPPPPDDDDTVAELARFTTKPDPDSAGRSSRRTPTTNGSLNSDVHKKVAFLSPPQTPTPALDLESSSPPAVMKTNVSRFQAQHAKVPPRASTSSSAGASSSKTDLGAASVKATSTRTVSPYMHKQDGASAQSLRSGAGTPYSQMSNNTSGSRILAAQSWSEVTEEDLVSNIGSRERTRQEVLFEIISSEERYVQELAKMKDTFIEPLLHPYSAGTSRVVSPIPLSSTPNLDYDYNYTNPNGNNYRSESPLGESNDQLPPIAARFMSPTPSLGLGIPKDSTPNIDGESMDTDGDGDDDDERVNGSGKGKRDRDRDRLANASQAAKHNHPRSPYRASAMKTAPSGSGSKSVPFPTRSHHSLPPPPRGNPNTVSTQSLGRQSTITEHERERNYSQGQQSAHNTGTAKGMLRKMRRDSTKEREKEKEKDAILGDALAPHQLPEDLRICLEVIDSGVFDGHKRLCEALKKRYDDQYPLVRSLADVFVANSDIFHGYATYVLHLERALEQVDNALNDTSPTKTTKKQQQSSSANPYWPKICTVLRRLENDAAEKGETGLAITLSKPFQRLLKYPLLFQNLLFHTDPSTFEYESTLQMVAEVESIVRSIEDEKIQKEERDKTRDVFARIEGLDKVRQVALPKPSRVLLEERQYVANSPPTNGSPLGKSPNAGTASPPPAMQSKPIRGKSSFKRLSDVLSNSSKKDLWLVVFNDVVLLCQRTGTTSLPLVAATNSRTNSLPELASGKSKYATTSAGRRGSHTKPRNLYKFVKIENWAIGDVVQPREGVVSMEDMVRSRTQQLSSQPKIVPMPADNSDDDDGNDSSDSDRKSKMSFSYWGADKVTVQKPIMKAKTRVVPNTRRGGPSMSPAYARESSANAKFGTRLVSAGESSSSPRPPSSRRAVVTPTSRRTATATAASEDSHKATVTRPGWNTSTRPAPKMSNARSRNTSQTGSISTTVARTPVPAAKALSPAPSEDSGVGLYRQIIAKDLPLNGS